MSTILPNPFSDGSRAPSEEAAAASPASSKVDAAAGPFAESSMSTGGTKEAPADANMGSASAGLLVDGPDIPLTELVRRGFDEEAFLNDLERLPAFLSAPSQEYLKANELMPVLHALAGH